jgi:protein transport protein SEC31
MRARQKRCAESSMLSNINSHGQHQILTGHEKGVLSLSWCKQDADLLLSSGKDNRALCWNPQTSEIIGEVGVVIT